MEKARIRWGAADAADCKLSQSEDYRNRPAQRGNVAGSAGGAREGLAQEHAVLIVVSQDARQMGCEASGRC